ncbi:MAG: penicillin-binding protein 2 [Nocardioidaceae bacterium]|nr:penicillin-binding protein 2 [Nocardioidaceae bacterium]
MLSSRSRLRLVVVQVMVVSLFVTLIARLWYIQVVGGDTYHAAAEQNTLRDVAIPAPRGLIVDAEGRPLVANRTSWVVTVDRDVLDGLRPHRRRVVVGRLAATLGLSRPELLRRTKICGEAGAARAPLCWNGSPYEPVPVAEDVSEALAATILERSEDYPGVTAEARKVRTYPSPFGVNAAHLLGYDSPITSHEVKVADAAGRSAVSPLSVVGRTGLEYTYNRYLSGDSGQHEVSVDSMGRVISGGPQSAPTPGDTLVTSLDAKIQALAEKELARSIDVARHTVDPVTHRRYVADSGSVVVLDAKNGRVVAMASNPTYNPARWVGGITQRDLNRLYSAKADQPLLSRAMQGLFAPGSTFKPFTTAAALTHGYSTHDRLDCSSSLTVGNRVFKNYESAAYGPLTFAQALQLSCDTFFYRVGYAKWLQEGGDSGDVSVKDPLVQNAKNFGFGRRTGIDIPGEVPGRIADRTWKLSYWKANKAYYCKLGKEAGTDYIHVFAREFCVDGWRYRAGDAVNFAIGQGDTVLTPLQLAVGYAAISNGGTLWEPRVGKAIIDPAGHLVRRIPPKAASKVPIPHRVLHYIDHALEGTGKVGTMAWKMGGFPLNQVKVRFKTGTAEVYGKQTTSWVASYDKQYVVVMQISQGGTGSGTSGEAVRHIWEALYGIHGSQVVPADAAEPGAHPPAGLPAFRRDGQIEPPPVRRPR